MCELKTEEPILSIFGMHSLITLLSDVFMVMKTSHFRVVLSDTARCCVTSVRGGCEVISGDDDGW